MSAAVRLRSTVSQAVGGLPRQFWWLWTSTLVNRLGGFVVTFLALGLRGADGVTFGLVRRFRELVWVGIGLALFAALRRGPVVAAVP